MADSSAVDLSHHTPSALEAAHAAQEHAEDIADALKVTELRYRRLFETARDGILLLDSETGAITDANPFMEELLGYSHAEFLGRELWEIGLLANKAASQEAFHHLQRDHYIRFENLPLETRLGDKRDVEFVSNLYRENGHSVIQCNIRDITERRKIDFSLTESEARFRTLYETMPRGILYQNAAGTLTSANPAAQQILGLTLDKMEGRLSADPRWEAVHEDGTAYPGDQHPPMQALRTAQPVLGVVMGVFNPVLSETRWLRVNSVPQFRPGEDRPYEVYTTFEDITERKDAEGQLAVAAVKNERIAETLQRSMLQKPKAGKFPGVTVETLYAAAMKEAGVGGDFFDAFALSETKVALVVGDVSGKGLVAAARTAEVKYALRAFLHAHPAPDLALAHLNEFIYETHRLDADNTEAFIVLALAVLDTATGEAVFSTAGAEPTLILRADGTVEAMEITGMPLGIQGDAVYTARTAQLGFGETVLMTTDGITEARRGDEFLGSDGVASLAAAGPTASLREMIQAIYDGAQDFAGGALHDDACLLVARRN